jgi:hypothetical protein
MMGAGSVYLGDLYDDIARIAGQVESVASRVKYVGKEMSSVARGEKQVATIPSQGPYAAIPLPGSRVGVSVPLIPLLAGAAALVWLVSRRSR